MASVLPFLVALCIAGATAEEYSYSNQLMMARSQTYGGNGAEICKLPPEVGSCKGHYPKYYYDKSEEKCKEFIYGGCYGNLNNFETESECVKTCSEGTARKPKWIPDPPYLRSVQIPSVCYEPKQVGRCYAYMPRYYYNSTDEICKEFIYGGCEGNNNNFETFEECNKTCSGDERVPVLARQSPLASGDYETVPRKQIATFKRITPSPRLFWGRSGAEDDKPEICFLRKDEGPCEALIPRWYYDSTEAACMEFNYGGCRGNKNNFDSFEQCNSVCVAGSYGEGARKNHQRKLPPPMYEQRGSSEIESTVHTEAQSLIEEYELLSVSSNPVCDLPMDSGPCMGYFPRWYYNSTHGICERFIYGGCKGNANNFETFEACNNTCPSVSDSQGLRVFKTLKPKVTPKYRISEDEEDLRIPVSEEPYPYTYVDVCQLPKKVGPCKAHIPRYYFNTTTDTCELFYYGGCQGNANNFETLEECKTACVVITVFTESQPLRVFKTLKPKVTPKYRVAEYEDGKDEEDICQLPKKVGPCKAHIPRYYYNTTTETCELFYYGGCEGNANNFESLGECQNTCVGVSELQSLRVFKTLKPKVTPKYRVPEDEDYLRILVTREPGLTTDDLTYSAEPTADPRIIAPPERSAINICHLPPDRGPCRGSFPKYYYDAGTNSCKRFIYGGCQGNANRFDTKRECMKTCRAASVREPIFWGYPKTTPRPS